MQIGVVFGTTTIDPVTQAFLVEAWDRQSEEFCKAWEHHLHPRRPLRHDPRRSRRQDGEIRVMMVEDKIDVDGALGYHTDELGLIFARILAENNAESGPHECCEESLDPDCSIWKPMPDGREIAFESCDPVEGDSYQQDATIGDETRQIPVSNYVLPSYFDPNGQHPFDRMGKLTAPFTLMTRRLHGRARRRRQRDRRLRRPQASCRARWGARADGGGAQAGQAGLAPLAPAGCAQVPFRVVVAHDAVGCGSAS